MNEILKDGMSADVRKAESSSDRRSNKIRALTMTALLLACAIVLSIVEGVIPPLGLPPGVKLGLSNIPIMYAMFFCSRKSAFLLALMKSAFIAFSVRFISGFMSLSGGMLSLLVMCLLFTLFKDKISFILLSIAGAVFHNIGQITAASILYSTIFAAYLPILLIAGVVSGTLTAILLKHILPAFKRMAIYK